MSNSQIGKKSTSDLQPHRPLTVKKHHRESYVVAKIRKQHELQLRIQKLKRLHKLYEQSQQQASFWAFSTLFDSFTTKLKSDMLQVDEYWEDDHEETKAKVVDKTVYGALVIQYAIRTWLYLSKMRKKINASSVQKTIAVLTESKDQKEEREKLKKFKEQQDIDQKKRFRKFCEQLKEGMNVKLLTKNDITFRRCTLKFDKEFRYLTYSTNRWFGTSIPLNSLYFIGKGLTEKIKDLVPQAHNPWCVHVKATDNVEFFLEADSSEGARILYDGLLQLHLKLFSQEPFYVDATGIPRRACPSIIMEALAFKDMDEEIEEFSGNLGLSSKSN